MYSELGAIYDQIFRSLISPKRSNPSFIKVNKSIRTQERLGVNRYTIIQNFVKDLRISYPGVWKLLGEECARGAALAYAHYLKHLTSRGNINKFGANFPEYLRTFPPTSDLIYLPDFAKLEWLRALSHDARQESVVSIEELQSVIADNIESYKFRFNSSVFFMISKFPLSEIQDLLERENSEPITLSARGSYIIICRVDNNVRNIFLDQHSWEFLFSLSQGNSLGTALCKLDNTKSTQRLEQLFTLILSNKMLLSLN